MVSRSNPSQLPFGARNVGKREQAQPSKPDKIDPLMLDIPQQHETRRLLLCEPQPSLNTVINPAVNESLESLKPWFDWAQKPQTPRDTERYIRQAMIKFYDRTEIAYYLLKKSDGDFVGRVGILPIDWDVPTFTLDFWVNQRFHEQGFMTEAIEGMAQFAFQKCYAYRIQIECDTRNHLRADIAESAQFTYEGTRQRCHRDVEGNLCDIMTLVRFNT